MKATLTFKLPKDNTAFLAAAKAQDLAHVLWEIVYNLRKSAEWHYEGMDNAEYDKLRPLAGVEYIMDEITRIMDENGIDINQLTE